MAAVAQHTEWVLHFIHPSDKWTHFKASLTLIVGVQPQALCNQHLDLSWSGVQFRSLIQYIWELPRDLVIPCTFSWEPNSPALYVQNTPGMSSQTTSCFEPAQDLCIHLVQRKKTTPTTYSCFFLCWSFQMWQCKTLQPWLEYVYLTVSANQAAYKALENTTVGWSTLDR